LLPIVDDVQANVHLVLDHLGHPLPHSRRKSGVVGESLFLPFSQQLLKLRRPG
jgi:hypothetical protein